MRCSPLVLGSLLVALSILPGCSNGRVGKPEATTCTSFSYSDWSPSICPSSGTQTRTVTASSPAGCVGGTPDALTDSCTPGTPACTSFTYTAWTPATCPQAGMQTRTVASSSPAGCTGGSPGPLTQSCTPTPVICTSFTYTAWDPATCPANGTQTRTVASSSPAGCTGGSRGPLTQSCVPISCTGVTCSNQGTCSLSGGFATCTCNPGYHPSGVQCLRLGIFQQPEPWTKDVSGLTPSARSDAIIAALTSLGGWGTGSNNLQIDFSLILLTSDASTPRRTVTATPDNGYCYGATGPNADCDPVPLQVPIPTNGNAEGSSDYACDYNDNDCHVLVLATDEQKLYELYMASGDAASFVALGAFVWDLTKAYPDTLRGEQCTSADAAGLPIAGLLVTADEVAAGEIPHAIRFILPNARMKRQVYVHPATHAGGPSSTNPNAPPYGVRFRLKASFEESPYNAAEKIVLAALKKYGMILSDGGSVPLTFSDDRLSTAKWADLGITSQSFRGATKGIPPSAFEVVDLGEEIPVTWDCVRNP